MIADIPDFLRRLPDGHQTPCYGHGRLFTSDTPADQNTAAALCADCPIREGCADHATDRGEPEGVWGGLTPDDRAARRAPACGTEAAWRRHAQLGDACTTCSEAHEARLRDNRLTRLAAEHARPEGGSLAGYRLELLLGLPTCARCRAVRRAYYADRPRTPRWYRRGQVREVTTAA
ncbi:WhiB family transcriptional regulator [Streptomyces taklimakanensis]|uniref:WhiB family transcriptional regulator n=1 Tax=Streptomyces taklimakanensis TaxID=2569853 RepID=UPI001391F674|nr:WhiB family transcriptional regulator [Streptomyces taklimakanensis]